MKIYKGNEGTAHEYIKISEVEGDMGEDTRLGLFQQADGDVILSLDDIHEGRIFEIEFCTSNGGGRYPIIARKLRELISELIKIN
ncbi:MAG: hypothetical protein PHI12_06815 [Dehalococcoidales bacterium]|nr:hypothetical protein [Dehalococcoidales bacterium]